LEQYLELFEKLNIEVYEILFGTFADTIPLTSKKERMYGGCLVNIGADNTTVTIFENEMPVLTKILKIGGSNITNDIAIGLNISLEEAEDIKKKNRAANKKIVDNIVHARLKDICELIRIEILKVSRVGKLTGGIVLTGGSAKIENIDEVFKKILDMNVKNASNIMPKLTDGILRDGIFSTAYGLTFLSSKEEKVSAKFYRKTKAFGRKILQVILP
jgi:cell division protein FtsA